MIRRVSQGCCPFRKEPGNALEEGLNAHEVRLEEDLAHLLRHSEQVSPRVTGRGSFGSNARLSPRSPGHAVAGDRGRRSFVHIHRLHDGAHVGRPFHPHRESIGAPIDRA